MSEKVPQTPADGTSKVPPKAPRRKKLRPEAERALAEAAERRKALEAADPLHAPKELGGRTGPEPTRYGDWEKKGIISDF